MRNVNSLFFNYSPGFLLVCLLLMAATCKKSNKKSLALANTIVGKTWLHAHEEDHGDTLVFRPNSFDFPPSRGRTGFTLEKDGLFRQYDIAPTDGLEEHDGRWEMQQGKTINVTFPDRKTANFTAEIISAEPELLKVKKTYKQ